MDPGRVKDVTRVSSNAAAALDGKNGKEAQRARHRWHLPIAAVSLFAVLVTYGRGNQMNRTQPSLFDATTGWGGTGGAAAVIIRPIRPSSAGTSCPVPFSFRHGKNKILHYHQHKAGGKTVNFIMHRLRTVGGENVNFKRRQEIHGKREKLMQYTTKDKLGTNRYVTFVRKPAAKIMSRFYYHRNMCNGTGWLWPSWKLVGVCCLTLDQYVIERALNNNQYESLIAGQPMGPLCSPSDPDAKFESNWERIRRGKLGLESVCPAGREAFVQRAEQILANQSGSVFIGIVERWDESLLLLAAMGGFDPASVAYCRKNANYGTPKPQDLQDGARGESGKEILKTVMEFNSLDDGVYEAATRLFERNVACWNNASHAQADLSTNTSVWQNVTLAKFQGAHCSSHSKRMYNPVVAGLPDGNLINPSFFIPNDLPIMLSQETGNKTCPELLKDFSDCPWTKFLEPC